MTQIATEFDLAKFRESARGASRVLTKIKEADHVDLSPVTECGKLIKKLLQNQCALLYRLDDSVKAPLLQAAKNANPDLKTHNKLKDFLGEVVGITMNIAKAPDEKRVERTRVFLESIAN
ncbi:MAG: hypothetical protein KBD06_01745 [Candidatus Pacebacteria bacterium]|nr:hypothetical protein [Candidatus Paceibacterota bacterium]